MIEPALAEHLADAEWAGPRDRCAAANAASRGSSQQSKRQTRISKPLRLGARDAVFGWRLTDIGPVYRQGKTDPSRLVSWGVASRTLTWATRVPRLRTNESIW